MLQLLLSSKTPACRFLFCSSIASVLGKNQERQAKEEPSTDARDAGPIGYSQSKWVAEAVCEKAASPALQVDIIRLGQLCGDTKNGIWNETEAWPLLIRASADIGAAPALPNEVRRHLTAVALPSLTFCSLSYHHGCPWIRLPLPSLTSSGSSHSRQANLE